MIPEETILAHLFFAGVYYEASSSDAPLVGYAATDNKGRQLVGEVYFNFAKAEEESNILNMLSVTLGNAIFNQDWFNPDDCVVCPMPEGGRSFGAVIASRLYVRMLYPETVVLEVATDEKREKKELRWKRHMPGPEDRLIIIEDVCNKFSTTAQFINMTEKTGAEVVAIGCMLNRSTTHTTHFEHNGRKIPILSVLEKAFPSFDQDDPQVADRVRAGNVVWKPKHDWDKLAKWMEK